MDWIGDGMSQIKLTEYQTMHQNASIGGKSMLATQVCVWPACAKEGNAKTKIFSLFMDWIGDGMSK